MRRRGVGRVGRPSLLGTAARTAVISGTATAVSGRVAANQMAQTQNAAERQAEPPSTVDALDVSPMVDQLRQLDELRQAGILTEDEFSAKKAQVLGI